MYALSDQKIYNYHKTLYSLGFKKTVEAITDKTRPTVSTVHKFQGKQAENIAVTCTSRNIEEIYDSLPHCLITLSRLTKSFVYIIPTMNPTEASACLVRPVWLVVLMS